MKVRFLIIGAIILYLISAVVVPYSNAVRLRSVVFKRVNEGVRVGTSRKDAEDWCKAVGYDINYFDTIDGTDLRTGHSFLYGGYSVWLPFGGLFRVKVKIEFEGDLVKDTDTLVYHESL